MIILTCAAKPTSVNCMKISQFELFWLSFCDLKREPLKNEKQKKKQRYLKRKLNLLLGDAICIGAIGVPWQYHIITTGNNNILLTTKITPLTDDCPCIAHEKTGGFPCA